MNAVETKETPRTAIYIKLETRDRINLFKARFSPLVGRVLTQDETMAVLMDAWDKEHGDAEAVSYAGK